MWCSCGHISGAISVLKKKHEKETEINVILSFVACVSRGNPTWKVSNEANVA